MSASQRRKGANGENELARILSDYFGRVVKRTLGQARDGGHDIETPPFRWEVKRRKAIAVYDFIEQAAQACQDGATPVVAMRADGKGWLVLMRLDDALPLIGGELTPVGTYTTEVSAKETEGEVVTVSPASGPVKFRESADLPVYYTHAVVASPDGTATVLDLAPTETDWPPQEVVR